MCGYKSVSIHVNRKGVNLLNWDKTYQNKTHSLIIYNTWIYKKNRLLKKHKI